MLETRKSFSTRNMAVTAMLGALSMVLGMTPLGFIPVGTTSATIMHIPVIIGAIVEGPMVGAMVGLIFGMFSLIRAITAPTVTSFVFWNPLVSVLPRVLIGIGSYYIYQSAFKITGKKMLSYGITGALGTLINTAGVLSMVYFIYAEQFVKAIGISTANTLQAITAIGLTNGIPEMIVATLIVPAAAAGITKIRRQ